MKLFFILLATFLTARGKPDQKTLGMQLVRLYSGSNTGYKRLELIEVINFKKEEALIYRLTILAGMMDCLEEEYEIAPDQCQINKVGYCYGRFQEDTSMQFTNITFMLCPGFNRNFNPIEFEFDIDPTYPITFKMAEKSIAKFNKSLIIRKVERGKFKNKKDRIDYMIHVKAVNTNELLRHNLTDYHCFLKAFIRLWVEEIVYTGGECSVIKSSAILNKYFVDKTLRQTPEAVHETAIRSLEVFKSRKSIRIISFDIRDATIEAVNGIRTNMYMTITYCPLNVEEYCNLSMDCFFSFFTIPWESFSNLEATCVDE